MEKEYIRVWRRCPKCKGTGSVEVHQGPIHGCKPCVCYLNERDYGYLPRIIEYIEEEQIDES